MHQDPREHLEVIFKMDDDYHVAETDDMIIVSNISFVSTCEHHMAPFRGMVHVGYIPDPRNKEVVGLSKVSRVVELFARRLQLQERLTNQVAGAIDTYLKPLGVIAVAQAVHYCMVQRGVKQQLSTTLTTARRGAFVDNPLLETKFQEYLRIRLDGNGH